MIFMPDLFFFQSKIFSGFRSQWIIPRSSKYSNEISNYIANLQTRFALRPQNPFSFRKSYRFIESFSKTITRWFLKSKCSIIHMIFFQSSASFSYIYWRSPTSTVPYFFSFCWFLTIFNATSDPSLWSKQCKTTPKLPFPNCFLISYLNEMWSPFLHKYSPFMLSYPLFAYPSGGLLHAFQSNKLR